VSLQNAAIAEVMPYKAEVFGASCCNEKYIVSVNNTQAEIFTQQGKSFDFDNFQDKAATQNPSQSIVLGSVSNNINIKNINELSAILASEICTRAP